MDESRYDPARIAMALAQCTLAMLVESGALPRKIVAATAEAMDDEDPPQPLSRAEYASIVGILRDISAADPAGS